MVSLGRYDEAEARFAACLPWWRASGNQTWTAHALFHLGLAAYVRGDQERTRALCEEAARLFDAAGCELDAIEPLHYLGLDACAAGDAPRAAGFFADALVRLRVRRSPPDVANGLADVATLAVTRGDADRGARLFGAADALRREGGAPFALPARLAFEEVTAAGKARLGEAAWAAAFGGGQALTVERALAEAETELAITVGASAPRPEPVTGPAAAPPTVAAAPYDLSPREREVLRRLAQRQADREIAAALSISPRTVTTHVAHIFDKLGVHSRREAAAVAARHGLA